MLELLAVEGVSIAAIYICPHTPESGCECRKPKPGLVLKAAASLDFAARDCWVIGDKACDTELGNCIGAATLLVRTGYGVRTELMCVASNGVVDDLCAAATFIQERVANRIAVTA